HTHLAGYVLARAQLELLEPLLVPAEGVGGGVQRPHEPGEPGPALLDDPEAEGGEAVEHPVDDQRAEHLHHRVLDGDVVDGTEVAVAAMEVRHWWQVVLEDHRVDEPA